MILYHQECVGCDWEETIPGGIMFMCPMCGERQIIVREVEKDMRKRYLFVTHAKNLKEETVEFMTNEKEIIAAAIEVALDRDVTYERGTRVVAIYEVNFNTKRLDEMELRLEDGRFALLYKPEPEPKSTPKLMLEEDPADWLE
jgi:predicted RNA-binding Zn-ribbon protein involved in translation (DUF1610 family)